MNDLIRREDNGHILPKEKASYNERLFRSGFRRKYHEARFYWLHQSMQSYQIDEGSVLELGCYDARSIDFMPFQPKSYLGIDANWENGLDLGKQKWGKHTEIEFFQISSVNDIKLRPKTFDFGICLETIEHLPESELEEYLLILQQSVKKRLWISVPVELGPLAFAKYLFKSLFLEVDKPYQIQELWHLFWGNLEKIKRIPLGHKGFDYRELVEILKKYFVIESMIGLPFTKLPIAANLACGIVLRPISYAQGK